MKRNTIIFWLGLCVGVLCIATNVLLIRFSWLESTKPEQIGVSFSQVQAERFGTDWRENYLAVLSDLRPKHIRVATYWDRIEQSPGVYDFSELDWMVEQARQRDIALTVVVGQKVIRVPECYYPTWLNRDDSAAVAEHANKLIAAVAQRYQHEPTIKQWQLENEFLLRNFGDCPSANLTNGALLRELITLQQNDSARRPIVLTQSDQWGFPVIGPFANTYGFSMYRTVWCGDCKNYFHYPQGGWFNWWKAAVINFVTGSSIKIHELQAEAWGPVGNENLSYDEAQKSMNPQKLWSNITYARDTHIKEFDLWGAEWWYWLKVHDGHPEMWEAAKQVFSSSNE